MDHKKAPFTILVLTIAAGLAAQAQPPPPGHLFSTTGRPPDAHRAASPPSAGRAASPPSVRRVASPPSAVNMAYPQSLFVDSRNGNIWVADFDNNRVLRFDASSLTDVGGPSGAPAPETYALAQNYPNPFNPATTITFALRNAGHASVKVYDLLGREVATLFDGTAPAHTVQTLSFDATGLPSGMYFYALRAAGRNEVRKMGVVK